MKDYYCTECGARLTLHEDLGVDYVCEKGTESHNNDLCEPCYDGIDKKFEKLWERGVFPRPNFTVIKGGKE